MDEATEELLMTRLQHIHERVQWMADEEARSVWVQGWAAQGGYTKQKLKLLDDAEKILDELMGKEPNA